MWRTALITTGFLLTPLAVLTAIGLLGIWAAVSRWHWFVRAMTLCGAVLLFVPIRAYEPAAIIALALPLIVVAIAIQRRRLKALLGDTPQPAEAARARLRPRFALRDLMLLIALAAVMLFGWRTINQSYGLRDWLALLTSAATLAATIVAARGIVVGRHRWAYVLLLAAILLCAPFAIPAAVPGTQVVSAWRAVGVLSTGRNSDRMAASFLLILSANLILFLILGVLTQSKLTPWRRAAWVLLPVLAIGLSVFPLLVYWRMAWPMPIPPTVTGDGNPYPRLLAIAEALGGNRGRGMAPRANPGVLAAEAAVLVEDSGYVMMEERFRTKAGLKEHHNSASAIREIARLFEAEADAAALAGDLADCNLKCNLALGQSEVLEDIAGRFNGCV